MDCLKCPPLCWKQQGRGDEKAKDREDASEIFLGAISVSVACPAACSIVQGTPPWLCPHPCVTLKPALLPLPPRGNQRFTHCFVPGWDVLYPPGSVLECDRGYNSARLPWGNPAMYTASRGVCGIHLLLSSRSHLRLLLSSRSLLRPLLSPQRFWLQTLLHLTQHPLPLIPGSHFLSPRRSQTAWLLLLLP